VTAGLAADAKDNAKMLEHLNQVDPHNILPQVDTKLGEYVKKDGTTPFTGVQTGVDPTGPLHLTTKRFVEAILQAHKSDSFAHNITDTITAALSDYTKSTDIYLKNQTYS
jgi:hypothetical protein